MSLFSSRAALIPSNSLIYDKRATTVLENYDVRYKGFEYRSQTTRNIFFFHVMFLTQRADLIDQAGNSLELVHDNAPFFLVVLQFL